MDMHPSRMNKRPADLPDFSAPPLTEVILGVQFDSLERFLSPHLGLVWERFKSKFPHVEEHPPLVPVFETFGAPPQFVPSFAFQVMSGAEMSRVFFINDDRTQLLQVQRDRFLHNWRKVDGGDGYPRFERMLETFEHGLRTFSDVIEGEKLGVVRPNQCEVSYINQIAAVPGEGLFSLIKKVFPGFAAETQLDELGNPEDARTLLRYVLRDNTGNPVGRLLVATEPGRRQDGTTILQVTLTARGQPAGPSFADVVSFLEKGRIAVVRGFTQLTSAAMHELWERTQ
jgi:uncharacterized protein (TIGR04255 family)